MREMRRFLVLRLRLAIWACALLVVAACNLSKGSQANEAALTATPAGTWISLLAPQVGDSIALGAHLELSARVENASDEIERAEIRIDGEIVRRYLLPNRDGADSVVIRENWLADRSGERELRVYVCFADGSCIESAPVVFTVLAPVTELRPIGAAATKNATAAFATVTPEHSPTPVVVSGRITTEVLNVRAGPSIQFELVSTLQKGEKVRIFARTEDEWYKIFLSGEERWIYGAADAGLVELSGPYSSLPIDSGPPQPTVPPATETPIPPQYPNLVIEAAELEGGMLKCGEAGQLRFRVRNAGVAPTKWGGSIRVRDIHTGSDDVRNIQTPNFGILAAGESTPLFKLNLYIDTHYDEEHVIEIIVDADQQVTESNELDNRWEYAYTLQRGACP